MKSNIKSIITNISIKSGVFYESGLRFSCKRCSSCCRYDSGYVYLTDNDLIKLHTGMGMDKNSFISVYCRWIEDYRGNKTLSLKEKANKDCIFWDNGCSVYENRPEQCCNFPFWESIVSSQSNWYMASTGCPGMNSGKLYTKEEIDRIIGKGGE